MLLRFSNHRILERNNTERYVGDSTHSPVAGKNCFSCISFRETIRLIKMIN